MSDELRAWLFKGLSVEHALNDLEQEGLQVRAPTDPQALQRVMPMEDFSPELRRDGMKALPSYLAFFMLENSARDLIVERLRDRHGSEWWEKAATSNIKRNVAQRREREGNNRWHMQRGASEIYYTDFGDLASLIENNWDDFADLFPNVDWVKTRFRELEASRNIVAHNNLLEDREIDRLKMNLSDWVRQIG